MYQSVTDAVGAARDEREKYDRLSAWLDMALIELERVPKPLENFFDEYQVNTNERCLLAERSIRLFFRPISLCAKSI